MDLGCWQWLQWGLAGSSKKWHEWLEGECVENRFLGWMKGWSLERWVDQLVDLLAKLKTGWVEWRV